MSKIYWTKQAPTREGYWWYRSDNGCIPKVFDVRDQHNGNGLTTVDGRSFVLVCDYSGEWSSEPINAPVEMVKHECKGTLVDKNYIIDIKNDSELSAMLIKISLEGKSEVKPIPIGTSVTISYELPQ